jgi:hypothetical protein
MATPRVSGGIFNNVVAQGSLRFFKLISDNGGATGKFADTVSDGTIIIPGVESGESEFQGGVDHFVANGQPVPGSVADRIFKTIMENCTVVLISIIDDDNVHFICENEGFTWGAPALGGGAAGQAGSGNAVTEMLIAIKALGTIGSGAAGSLDSPIPDSTDDGATAVDLDVANVELSEVNFDIVA